MTAPTTSPNTRRPRAAVQSVALGAARLSGMFWLFALALLVMAGALAPWNAARAQGLLRDAEIEDTLRVYTNPILEAAGLEPNDVHLFLVNDPSLNAFVSGGQNIFIHSGLIMAADNPNQLIGVIAHETGHIAGGHLARSREAMQQSMTPAYISIGLGILAIAAGAPDAGAALISGSQGFAMGNFVRHTQVQESSADQAAVNYLESSGQSAEGLIDFFNEELRQFEFQARRMPPYLMSHPFTSDRVEALRQRVAAQPNRDAHDSEDYLRRFAFMQAKLVGFLNTQGQTLARYPLSDVSQPARYARAVAYYRVSQLDQARAELDVLLRESPTNPYFQELYGQILFENGRAEESVAYHRRSTELAPDQPLLLINLARALIAARGREGADEAVRLLERAVALEPDNAYGWRELAIGYDLQGKDGMARLASAEQAYSIGDYGRALSFSSRARDVLPRGDASWQRATDIATTSQAYLAEAAERRRS